VAKSRVTKQFAHVAIIWKVQGPNQHQQAIPNEEKLENN
jgi:hypothetical protein